MGAKLVTAVWRSSIVSSESWRENFSQTYIFLASRAAETTLFARVHLLLAQIAWRAQLFFSETFYLACILTRLDFSSNFPTSLLPCTSFTRRESRILINKIAKRFKPKSEINWSVEWWLYNGFQTEFIIIRDYFKSMYFIYMLEKYLG